MSSKTQQSGLQVSTAEKHNFHFSLSEPGYQVALYSRVSELNDDWLEAQPPHNNFLHFPYLSTIEDNPPRRMQFCYLVFKKYEKPVGVAYCQVSNFRPDASIRETDTKDKYPCIIRALARHLKNLVASKFDHNLLVCGNLLLTGEHGFYFKPDEVNRDVAFKILEESLQQAQTYWEKRGLNIDAIFIKDIIQEHRAPGQSLVYKSFREFTFHPNMILSISPDWQTFDDYLTAITSKYRVRAKRAFRLSQKLEQRELTTEQIYSFGKRMYELYKDVMDTASFNMVTIHENYLPALKDNLGDQYRVFGYFRENDLVAFRTTITNGDELEAHFLGFDQTENKDSQIYLNMLFDTLRQGIEQKAVIVVYSRTAMEIKSSIGAKDFQMYCYIRANNKLTNAVLPPLLEYLRPPDSWVARNPFK